MPPLCQTHHGLFLRLIRSRDKYYLVFELAAGGELYDHLIEEGRFGEAEAKEVVHALVVSGRNDSLCLLLC